MSFRDKHRELVREGSKETLDQTPLHVPGLSDRPLTLREELRRFVQQEVSRQAVEAGAGSFEDEDDFTDDEGIEDLSSPYTVRELLPEAGGFDDLEGAPQAEDTSTPPLHCRPKTNPTSLRETWPGRPSRGPKGPGLKQPPRPARPQTVSSNFT